MAYTRYNLQRLEAQLAVVVKGYVSRTPATNLRPCMRFSLREYRLNGGDDHASLQDLRNHGSSPHVEPMNYPVMANDVLHFLRKHSLSNVSLIGHSM